MRHRWWLAVVATCVALVFASSPGAWSSSAWAQGGSWSLGTPYPAAVNEVAVVGFGNKLHVLGGSVLGVAGPYHEVYDPETDKWSARAMLPRGLDHIGAAVANGKIYTIGGFVGSVHRDAQNAVYEYDPASNAWSKKNKVVYIPGCATANSGTSVSTTSPTISCRGSCGRRSRPLTPRCC